MNNLKLTLLTGLSVLVAATSFSVTADEVSDRVAAALANPARDPADSARDELRMPAEAMAFVGITTGMSVLDVGSGAGWYAEPLAAAVGPTGNVYSQNGSRFAERVAPALALKVERFPNITPFVAENADFGMDGQTDAAWTALNLHDNANRSHEAGIQFLTAIYDTLKPGGVLGFIDHEGTAGRDNAAMHRIDVGTTIALLQEVGFVVEAQSYLLDNPLDDQTLNIRDDSLRFKTDRFLLRARKPAM